jgi:D-3-phosphoglycerate dehydrogenase
MTTILFSAPYMIPIVDRLRPIFEHHDITLIIPEVHERMEEDDLIKYAGQFDGAICGDDYFTARVLDACSPRLKVISKWGTGIDSIDQEACTRLGIQVGRTLNAFTQSVADTVMGYILTFARRLPWMDRELKAGRWNKLPCRSLGECTLGVIGVGNIGKAVLRRARAFDMKLTGNDIVEIDPAFLVENNVRMTSLRELLSQADYISLNCDLNPTSHHLINSGTLAVVKADAVMINTSRGPVVDELALVAALQSGMLGGAALDVFDCEPLPPDSPLLSMDNVMLAPHNANSSPAAWDRVHLNTIRNLLDGLGISSDTIKI